MANLYKRMALMALATGLSLGVAFPQLADAKQDRDEKRIEQQLTQEQRDKFRQLKDENRARTADIRKAYKEKKGELESIMRSENPDKTRIQALSAELGVLRGKLLCAEVDLRGELKNAGLPERALDRDRKDFYRGDKRKGDRPKGDREKRGDREKKD